MKNEESIIQQHVVLWARSKYPNVPMTCAPAYAKNAIRGSMNKRMGYCKGWPDLFFAVARKWYNGLFIELKTETGKIQPEQREILNRLDESGYRAVVCRSVNDAIEVIDSYVGGR